MIVDACGFRAITPREVLPGGVCSAVLPSGAPQQP